MQASSSSGPGGVSTDFTVELGWNIYVYLSRSDWLYLAGLTLAAASAALCGWIVASTAGAGIGAGVACAVATYIIRDYILQRSAPPVGYCARFVISYFGNVKHISFVQRSC